MDVLCAALATAARGWPVFPCAPRSKRPATERGFHDATTDPERIRAWWAADARFNVATATGPVSGLLVLDIDGDPSELLAGRLVPASVTQRTGGGGYQVLFAWTPALEGFPTSRVKPLPGLDTRGRGGYVVLPPSIHPSGRPYRWCENYGPDEIPLAAPPRWLVEALTPAAPVLPARRAPNVDSVTSAAYVARAIDAECEALASAPEGARNATLNRAGYALARFVAQGDADADGVVRALAYAAARAGLPERETARTIASAFKARGVNL